MTQYNVKLILNDFLIRLVFKWNIIVTLFHRIFPNVSFLTLSLEIIGFQWIDLENESFPFGAIIISIDKT